MCYSYVYDNGTLTQTSEQMLNTSERKILQRISPNIGGGMLASQME